MKNIKYICCVLIGILASVMVWGYFRYLVPVGCVDGSIVFKYQLNDKLECFEETALKNMGKVSAFEMAMRNMKISVTEAEVDQKIYDMVTLCNGTDEIEEIVFDMIDCSDSMRQSVKKEMLKQRAIKVLVHSAKISESDLKAFYDEHSLDYTNFELEYNRIRNDYIKSIGEKMYDEYIRTYEKKISVEIF